MPDSLEIIVARIDERQKSMDKKLDSVCENQKVMFKAIEEFHTFKGQVKVWGTVAMLGITFLKDAAFKMFGAK